jgi:AdoMet-dependent heme synthase
MIDYASPSDEDVLRLQVGGKTFLMHKTLLGAPSPGTLSFEATNFCNLCCSHCGHSQYPGFDKGHFDMKYFHKVEHLLNSKIKGISLSNFGEPFMSKTWKNLFEKSLAVGSNNISFITNALLLDRHIEEILNPRISLAISVDGAYEETYSIFRGKNNFARLTENLALLKKIKSAKHVTYPEVAFLFTISRANCEDLPRIVDMAAQFGVSAVIVQFQIFFDRGRFGRESLYFAREDYDRTVLNARERASSLGVSLLHPDSFDGRALFPREGIVNQWLGRDAENRVRCYSQSAICYVKYNGAVEACCAPDHNIMGSLDFDRFEDIWHGPNYRHLRLSLDKGILPENCRCCSLVQVIDVHDERAHLIVLPQRVGEKKPGPQPYRVTELDRIYRKALSFLPRDPERARCILEPLSDIDENLYEVGNTEACLHGLRGNTPAMIAGLSACAVVAPKDPLIAENCAAAQIV